MTEYMQWTPQDDPRHPGDSTVVSDAAQFEQALTQALNDQTARDQQASAFQNDVHSTAGHSVNAGPAPHEGEDE